VQAVGSKTSTAVAAAAAPIRFVRLPLIPANFIERVVTLKVFDWVTKNHHLEFPLLYKSV
jgi:hypothetical protein